MKITLDASSDQVLIDFRDIEPGGIEDTFEIPEGPGRHRIWLSFDEDGRLIRIEVMQASLYLPPELLALAEPMGGQASQ